MSGLCYNSTAALCENIALSLWGRGRLDPMLDISRWSPALWLNAKDLRSALLGLRIVGLSLRF